MLLMDLGLYFDFKKQIQTVTKHIVSTTHICILNHLDCIMLYLEMEIMVSKYIYILK